MIIGKKKTKSGKGEVLFGSPLLVPLSIRPHCDGVRFVNRTEQKLFFLPNIK